MLTQNFYSADAHSRSLRQVTGVVQRHHIEIQVICVALAYRRTLRFCELLHFKYSAHGVLSGTSKDVLLRVDTDL